MTPVIRLLRDAIFTAPKGLACFRSTYIPREEAEEEEGGGEGRRGEGGREHSKNRRGAGGGWRLDKTQRVQRTLKSKKNNEVEAQKAKSKAQGSRIKSKKNVAKKAQKQTAKGKKSRNTTAKQNK